MPTPNEEIDRLREENTRLKDERREHNLDWQETVMGEFKTLNARISGLQNAITGTPNEPENGMQYRVLLLEREAELRRQEKKEEKEAAEKKFDRSLLVWPPLLAVIAERVWSWFSGKH